MNYVKITNKVLKGKKITAKKHYYFFLQQWILQNSADRWKS